MSFSASTIPGVPISCAVQIPALHSEFPGLIAMGPSRSERDVLYQCCHTLHTELFSVNDTACLQTVMCKVAECTLNDPSYACVALQRESWKINGTFACLKGSKESKGGTVKRFGSTWMVIAAVVSLVGFGAL
ncbi:uncharacterized protein K460DRAFT_414888 [Cucurbitaria berberidis CBS 394.84]|uniref:Uncharacterized protein n=1 Tax=Cucurbitaria berberidis CBS 394.84 TaxID=1168544 RepID=A0A9P4LAF0_9PLEO|nr:uncharacterized protein K460DRAFT_414888 [Cucurbitaria berberidis CBS 394.84]KAF1848316.1 hypothetical protein K460DRAFT_414888 [Cucurbitaria berberidis CBS 394.84]